MSKYFYLFSWFQTLMLIWQFLLSTSIVIRSHLILSISICRKAKWSTKCSRSAQLLEKGSQSLLRAAGMRLWPGNWGRKKLKEIWPTERPKTTSLLPPPLSLKKGFFILLCSSSIAVTLMKSWFQIQGNLVCMYLKIPWNNTEYAYCGPYITKC